MFAVMLASVLNVTGLVTTLPRISVSCALTILNLRDGSAVLIKLSHDTVTRTTDEAALVVMLSCVPRIWGHDPRFTVTWMGKPVIVPDAADSA